MHFSWFILDAVYIQPDNDCPKRRSHGENELHVFSSNGFCRLGNRCWVLAPFMRFCMTLLNRPAAKDPARYRENSRPDVAAIVRRCSIEPVATSFNKPEKYSMPSV